MIERFFALKENNTTVKTELSAGLTTFLTMAYIIFVQPAVLSGRMFGMNTGMDFGAITVATCLSAALATGIMALYARYPIAQAPGMGENFFFVFSVLPAAAAAGYTNAWQVGLGVVFVAGVLFLLLSLLGIRTLIVDAVSPSMKNGIAVGIGLFIAFIGLQNAGLIVTAASIIPGKPPILSPGTLVRLNTNFLSPDLLIFLAGLIFMNVLHARKIRGAILIGILATTLLAIVTKLVIPLLPPAISQADVVVHSKLMTQLTLTHHMISRPPPLSPTLFKMDVAHACSLAMLPFIIIFLFMDIFDTIGTLIGVGEQAGLMVDNKLPRAKQAMLSDAVGTVAGACMGTSTVTSFVESASGVEHGGRTGLTSLTTAILFLLALFLSPLIHMVGSYAPITAPALVLVGSMMLQNVRKIDWDDSSEAIPAFLVMLGIPLSYSIADGLALGFIIYPIVKLFSGKHRHLHWMMVLLAILLLLYFILIRASI
jgi:AGZA family xanthine/uracil permease-like MFS transporter